MHYENRHKPKNIPYTLAYRYRKDVAQNEPILIAPSAAVGESHGSSVSSTTGAGEAAATLLTAGVVVVKLAEKWCSSRAAYSDGINKLHSIGFYL